MVTLRKNSSDWPSGRRLLAPAGPHSNRDKNNNKNNNNNHHEDDNNNNNNNNDNKDNKQLHT